MNLVPARRRRSIASILLGALAMAGSFAVMGVLVLSDVADAGGLRKPVPVKVAKVEQPQTVSAEQAENAQLVAPEPEEKPVVAKKRARKRAKVDFGRFEGY
jgi:hypothetical protein